MNQIFKIGGAAIVGFLLLLGIWRLWAYRYIEPDEIGIWMTNGGFAGPSDYRVVNGSFPIDVSNATRGFVLPAQPWSVDMPQKTYYSAQKGEWTCDPTYTFRINRDSATTVCSRTVSMLREEDSSYFRATAGYILNPLVNDVFNTVIGQRADTTLMANTYRTQQLIEEAVKAKFHEKGYILENFVSNLNPPQSIIERNRISNLSAATAAGAQAEVIKAEAEARIQVAKATSSSKVQIIEAQTEAEVNQLRQRSLTPLMLEMERIKNDAARIQKWDGKNSQTVINAGDGVQVHVKPPLN